MRSRFVRMQSSAVDAINNCHDEVSMNFLRDNYLNLAFYKYILVFLMINLIYIDVNGKSVLNKIFYLLL